MFVRPLRVGTNNVICSCFSARQYPRNGSSRVLLSEKGTWGGAAAGLERTHSTRSRSASALEVLFDGQARGVIARARADAPVLRTGVGRTVGAVAQDPAQARAVVAATCLAEDRNRENVAAAAKRVAE